MFIIWQNNNIYCATMSFKNYKRSKIWQNCGSSRSDDHLEKMLLLPLKKKVPEWFKSMVFLAYPRHPLKKKPVPSLISITIFLFFLKPKEECLLSRSIPFHIQPFYSYLSFGTILHHSIITRIVFKSILHFVLWNIVPTYNYHSVFKYFPNNGLLNM